MIMTLNIEAPFKTSMYIDKAIHTLQIYDVDVVQSVIVDDGTFFEHDGTGLKPRLKNSLLRLERNNLFKQAGGIRIYQKSAVVKDKFSVGKIGHLMVDNRAAFELKSEFDWELVNNFI